MKGSPRKGTSLWKKKVFIATAKKEESNLKMRTVCLISFLCMSLVSCLLMLFSYNPEKAASEFWSAGITHERTWVKKCP